MKNTILVLIAAFSLNALAVTPVQLPKDTIAFVRTSGGMPFVGGLRSRLLILFASGEVRVKEVYIAQGGGDREVEYTKGFASAQDLALVIQAAESITKGGLTKPQGPECMDAPARVVALNKNPYAIAIQSEYNCRKSVLKDKNHRAAANAIVDYLKQWQ